MARNRPGWAKIRGGTAGVWAHASGWQIHHCGHPTALWPYYGVPPGGGRMLLSPNGRGFRRLDQAQEAVEAKAKEVT